MADQFDVFGSLMNNPMMQMGLGLFGTANPRNAGIINAYQMMNQAQEGQQKQKLQQQQIDMENARTQAYMQDVAIKKMQQERQLKMMEQLSPFLNQLQQSMFPGQNGPGGVTAPLPAGGAGVGVPPTPQAAAPMPSFSGQKGKYGTPVEILNNLAQTESSGNPRAVNPQSGAMGMYQFMPDTVTNFRNQGMPFDPFNPSQSRDMADYYIQQLVKQNGGDYRKALAAYGGFKAKDPTQYVNKVLGAREGGQTPGGTPPMQAAQIPSPTGQFDPQRAMQLQAGIMKLQAGDPSGLTDIAGGMAPRTYQPGAIVQDYMGNTRQIPDTYKERQLGQEDTKIAQADRARTDAENKVASDQAIAKSKAYQAVSSVNMSMDRLAKTAEQLMNHPGLGRVTGLTGALINPNLLGEDARNANAILESLRGQVFTNATQELRRASPTGAGVGQQSDWEGARLEGAMARLNQAQTTPAFKAALKDLIDFSTSAKANMNNAYKMGYEKNAPASTGTDQLPPGSVKIGTKGGKNVYQAPDGTKYLEP